MTTNDDLRASAEADAAWADMVYDIRRRVINVAANSMQGRESNGESTDDIFARHRPRIEAALSRPATPEPSAEADAALREKVAPLLDGYCDFMCDACLAEEHPKRPATPPLDVERLQTAYENAEATIRARTRTTVVRPFWDIVAAEYAALANPDPETA
jgi:hypothetical protein